ncbi:MAG: bifunctional folylpolyglutamate synthase/dihydrofolate synthase [Kiritimatiellae bacterium]|nr:bifunctional folylpolyglutamate synthase/dihydrofolate synthase [Kiritimatiellia bacterium]
MQQNSLLERLAARRRYGMRPGLSTMRALLDALGNPQDSLKVVHVAGTNGKGAVTAMLDAVLRAAGYRVCRYTSPHLVSLAERFFVDGAPASTEALDAAAETVFPVVEAFEREKGAEVTFFECLTAVAFVLFAHAKPDFVVIETGLGGRLDATNVAANVLVSVITRIGLDHCDWLGNTHVAIAEEKAGIIKPGRPVVCGAMPESAKETVERIASLNGSAFYSAVDHVSVANASPLVATTAHRNLPPINLALFGAFQVENALTVLTAVDALAQDCGVNIPDHAIVEGLESVVWPGRCQRVEKDGVTVIVDGAHNPDGAMALRDSLRLAHVKGPVGLIAGYCGDKDVLAHLRIMSALATRGWAVPIRNARSLDPGEVAERMLMAGFAEAESCSSLEAAFGRAIAWARTSGGTLVVCGSLFLSGEALVALDAFPWEVRTPDMNELTLR